MIRLKFFLHFLFNKYEHVSLENKFVALTSFMNFAKKQCSVRILQFGTHIQLMSIKEQYSFY